MYIAVSYNTANYLNSIAWAQLLIQPAATRPQQKRIKSIEKLELPSLYLNLIDLRGVPANAEVLTRQHN